MHDWHLPLVIAAAVFGLYLLWRNRPAFGRSRGRTGRAAMREAHARLATAKDEPARAEALADLGDVAVRAVGGSARAVGFYVRAMRAQPASTELVERAARAFLRRPRAFETLLWRRLGAEPWTGEATRVALRHLAHLYSGPLRNAARARAIENALAALSTE